MALRWIEGYEVDRSNTYLGRKYASSSGAPTATGRLHGFAKTLNSGAHDRTPSLTLQDEWTIGFGLKANGGTAVDVNIIFYRGATEQLRLHIEDTSSSLLKAEIKRGATILATVNNISQSVWHYFEFQATIHTSTGAFELRVDEIQVATGSGVNTADSGSNQADVFEWINSGATQCPIDDIYILDGTGGFNDDFRGDCTVEGISPTAEGATIQWTPSTGTNNAALVDDDDTGPGAGQDADHNAEGTVGDRDLYDYSDLSVLTGTIHGVMLTPYASLDLAGSRQFKAIYRESGGGVFDLGPDHTVDQTTIAGFSSLEEKNPNTATNWTISDINNGQFGVELVS